MEERDTLEQASAAGAFSSSESLVTSVSLITRETAGRHVYLSYNCARLGERISAVCQSTMHGCAFQRTEHGH